MIDDRTLGDDHHRTGFCTDRSGGKAVDKCQHPGQFPVLLKVRRRNDSNQVARDERGQCRDVLARQTCDKVTDEADSENDRTG